jgi:hypothetical protein
MELAANKSTALMTNVNSPSVSIFIGSVSRISIGLIIALINPITRTATRADTKSVKNIPGTILETINNAMAFTIQFASIVSIVLS